MHLNTSLPFPDVFTLSKHISARAKAVRAINTPRTEVHMDRRCTHKATHRQPQPWHPWVTKNDAIQHKPIVPGGRFPKQRWCQLFLSWQPLKCCSSASKGSVKVLLRLSPNKPPLSIFRDKIRHQSDWFPALHVRAERGGRQQPTHPHPAEVWLVSEGLLDSQWLFGLFHFLLSLNFISFLLATKLNLCFSNYFLTFK